MGMFISISPNMKFEMDPAFKNFNEEVVFDLFRLVDENFSRALETVPYSSIPCIISFNHFGNYPMCCCNGDFHHIYLHCDGNYWCQWMFQFAHEYCHHLIGGQLSGDILGLIWFEECVCELSSMYHLHNLSLCYGTSRQEHLQHYSPLVRNYLDECMQQVDSVIAAEVNHPGFLHKWETLLQEQKYHREHYRAIAAKMLPLFLENPHLWKIILHFGDMCRWHSLENLFSYLHRNATPDYSGSLEKLRLLLFS